MSNQKLIKSRIKSVKNTKKITKAMELVAASKMKRAVSATLSSRLYADYSWDLLTSLSGKLDEVTHPFFTGTTGEKSLIVLITSNRGLCGSYNSQAIKKALSLLKTTENAEIISVGKKGDNAMRRLARPDGSGIGQNIIASFIEIPDNATLNDIRPLSELITRKYKTGEYKSVRVIYTDFISALTQKANIRNLLPISKEEVKEMIENLTEEKSAQGGSVLGGKPEVSYIFEGDTNKLVEMLAEKLVRTQIYQMILESSASEQSSRMVAMKNASEAAGEMIDDLTLVFNKARQAGITQEISEISAGMASVS
jgi:F-type H+-transporting ATPase subunit gamma